MRKKILVVDDDTAVRESLMNALSYENYQPFGAADGNEALKILQTQNFALVLLDLNMPGRNGWDTYQEILTHDPLMPIIIITARPNQLFTSLGAGVGALIEKPLDFLKLLETIGKLIEESVEKRLARLTGRPAEFHYVRPNGNTVTYSGANGAEKEQASSNCS